MIVSHYHSAQRGLTRSLRIAIVADLHNEADEALYQKLREVAPEFVVVPGDFLNDAEHKDGGLAFLRACAALYPTYCSIGNHERKAALPDLAASVSETGAELLDNRAIFRHGMWIGGLSSGWGEGERQSHLAKTPPPDVDFIDDFASREGCRLLLCHHPEYYEPYLYEKNIPLIISGHAHGGQWHLFGHGIYAPGQGLFPHYTSGFYDGRLLVSRGLCKTRPWIPRIHNPRELTILDLWPQPTR
ncbi:MAG: metallophosphoesterase [Clostridia bacterium]|nr:metallophosphoesterase [Clostridia bacterium]